jgi:hypothetical protein
MTYVPAWAEHAARAIKRDNDPKRKARIVPVQLGPLAPDVYSERVNVSETRYPSVKLRCPFCGQVHD